jgi:hypothetical protein
MASYCRHIMPSGSQCHAYALQGEDLCYFHSRRRHIPGKPADFVEIPLLEDRCAIQITITQILRAVVNKTIERHQAQLLLYGLQLSLQSVDRAKTSIPFTTVKAVSESSDGEELAAEPYDEDEDDDEDDDDEEEDSDDESEDDDSGDSDSESNEDSDEEDDDSEEVDSDDDDDEDDDPDEESSDEHQSDAELVADAKYLRSISNALNTGDMREAARLLKE